MLVYYGLSRYDSAEVHQRAAVKLYSDIVPADPLALAKATDNLGLVLQRLGQLDEAEAEAQKALSIYQDLLEPTDSRIAESLSNLGSITL